MATPRRLALLALAVGAAGLILVYHRDPEKGAALLPCLWFEATGTHCPGCGTTRALHDLAHGRVFAALDHNAAGILVLLAAAAWLVRPVWIALRADRWEAPRWPRGAAAGLLVGGLAWAILRNLPWAPFALLAP